MIEAVLAPFVEIVGAIATAIFESCIWVLIGSIRPWRYVFSSSYRAQVQEQMRGRSSIRRSVNLFGGTVVLLGSVLIVSLLVWQLVPPPEPTFRENALEQIRKIIEAG